MSSPFKICRGCAARLAVKYRHAVWTALIPLYVICFFAIERIVTTDYWVSYSILDDMIPFVPEFVVFYSLWYPMLFAVGLYLLLRDGAAFRRYMWALMSGFFLSLLFFLILPNGQNLRPASFAENTFFTRFVNSIYSIDTNTNVMPSMHVIGTIIATIAVFDAPGLKSIRLRVFAVALSTLINMSTVFIKQHSVLDIFAGFAFCVVLYVVFYVFVKKRQEKSRAVKSSDIKGADTVM